MEYLSKQRYDEIAAELDHLIHVVYPEVREHVAETSAQGDRSENAGYREARRRQAKTISRIRFLQKVLEHSRVIDSDAFPKDRVCLLSRVEFTNLTMNTRMKFEIVSPHEIILVNQAVFAVSSMLVLGVVGVLMVIMRMSVRMSMLMFIFVTEAFRHIQNCHYSSERYV